jgi:hypothetical protein
MKRKIQPISALSFLALLANANFAHAAPLQRHTHGRLSAATPVVYGGAPLAGSNPLRNSLVHIEGTQCGGLLISPQHVLTANHCALGASGPLFQERCRVENLNDWGRELELYEFA